MSFHATALQYALNNFNTIWKAFETNANCHKENYIITYLEWQTNHFILKTIIEDNISTTSFFGDKQTPYNNVIFLFSETYQTADKQTIKQKLTDDLNDLTAIESTPKYQPSFQIACTKKAIDNFENIYHLINSTDDIGYGILVDMWINPKTLDVITSADNNETSCYFRDTLITPFLKLYRKYDEPLNKQLIKNQLEYELSQLTKLEKEITNALPLPAL